MNDRNILLVFDDPEYACRVREFFERKGIRPVTAESLSDMASLLKKEPFDLLVCPLSGSFDCMAIRKKAMQMRPEMMILTLASPKYAADALVRLIGLLEDRVKAPMARSSAGRIPGRKRRKGGRESESLPVKTRRERLSSFSL